MFAMKFAIGAVAGALCGYLMYRVVGCSTGACPLTANPWTSTIYGTVMGLLLAGGL